MGVLQMVYLTGLCSRWVFLQVCVDGGYFFHFVFVPGWYLV